MLGEDIACNQDPDSLHCKALKRTKSLKSVQVAKKHLAADIEKFA
jgi:hypothetical protein